MDETLGGAQIQAVGSTAQGVLFNIGGGLVSCLHYNSYNSLGQKQPHERSARGHTNRGSRLLMQDALSAVGEALFLARTTIPGTACGRDDSMDESPGGAQIEAIGPTARDVLFNSGDGLFSYPRYNSRYSLLNGRPHGRSTRRHTNRGSQPATQGTPNCGPGKDGGKSRPVFTRHRPEEAGAGPHPQSYYKMGKCKTATATDKLAGKSSLDQFLQKAIGVLEREIESSKRQLSIVAPPLAPLTPPLLP
ncbi:hypothetical protein NDU88_001187 [Pleurodeles waltl]|uniref:Uncharacterized protein n=1 Tax=Pleurodeles waltl TaxID=8319 RepID=A0AAV7VVP2_PLEWA|nr:hypothetical protein NDU88_001187 [Pleurodeles waltl]